MDFKMQAQSVPFTPDRSKGSGIRVQFQGENNDDDDMQFLELYSPEKNSSVFTDSPFSRAPQTTDFEGFQGFEPAENALSLFDDEEDAFVEETTRMERQLDLGSDHLVPPESLQNTPMVRRKLQDMMYSPGPYFQSRAPAMGSLDSEHSVPRPVFFTPNKKK